MDAFFGLDHAVLNEEGLALLTTVFDDVLVEIYADLLTDAGIPFLKKDRGGGTAVRIITGANWYGTDIYVPEERLQEARLSLKLRAKQCEIETKQLKDTITELLRGTIHG